jgi:PAS domain S-box-containing protein
LRVTLESIGDGVIATDSKGVVTFANSVALELMGRSKTNVIGRPLSDSSSIVSETTRRSVANPVERVIREGKVVGLANHTVLLRPEGTEIPIDDSAAPIHDKEGRLIGVVLVFRSVSEQKGNHSR